MKQVIMAFLFVRWQRRDVNYREVEDWTVVVKS